MALIIDKKNIRGKKDKDMENLTKIYKNRRVYLMMSPDWEHFGPLTGRPYPQGKKSTRLEIAD